MTPPNNPPSGGSPGGSPGGPGIKIPAAGAPPNPKKQTVRISVPPKQPASPTPPIIDLEEDDSQGDSDTENEPSRLERIRLILTEYKTFFTICFCLIAVVLAVWFCLPKDYTFTSTKVDMNIRQERDELIKQIRLQEIERIRLTNEIESLQKGLDQLVDTLASNRVVAANQQSRSNTPSSSQPTNQVVTQTEPPQRFGSGLVTVNGNNGNIEIIIKNDDGERSVRTTHGPDKAEDIVPGLAEATGTESPINTDKSVPSGGNGIRYYLPKGWSLNYKYYCSQEDFEVFVNKGTREVPKWEAIDVSSDGRSESLWIRNLSRRNVKLTFTLAPAKK